MDDVRPKRLEDSLLNVALLSLALNKDRGGRARLLGVIRPEANINSTVIPTGPEEHAPPLTREVLRRQRLELAPMDPVYLLEVGGKEVHEALIEVDPVRGLEAL